jgi:hypothetical protein
MSTDVLFLLTRVSFHTENNIVELLLSNIINNNVDSPQMAAYLHHYICQSYYNNDISRLAIQYNEIFSELHKMGTLSQDVFNSEYMSRMIVRASLEFATAKKYIYHVYRKGISDSLRACSFTHSSNVYYINRKFREYVSNVVEKLTKLNKEKRELGNLVTKYNDPPTLHMNPVVITNDFKDIFTSMDTANKIECYVNELQQNIENITRLQTYYSDLYDIKKRYDIACEKRDTEQLVYDLCVKSLKFKCHFIKDLPDDIVSHIQGFIGEEFLSDVRKRCISRKYFPNVQEDLKTMLITWKVKHLLKYLNHVYLLHDVRPNDILNGRSYKLHIKRSSSKSTLIDYILKGAYKYNFYELHRDVYIITSILKSSRTSSRKPQQCKPTITNKPPTSAVENTFIPPHHDNVVVYQTNPLFIPQS